MARGLVLETWSEDLEDMWKREVCEVATMLTPEELELARYETNFPLLAARHPMLARERAGLSRLKVWRLILKKLPMPFDAMHDASVWASPPVLPIVSACSASTRRCMKNSHAAPRTRAQLVTLDLHGNRIFSQRQKIKNEFFKLNGIGFDRLNQLAAGTPVGDFFVGQMKG